MECPQCHLENREGAKFCKKCRAQLELVCPSCSTLLIPECLFCDECGYKVGDLSKNTLNDLSLDEKLNKIQRYLPKGLTEKILSQKDRIEGERKQVTVMFIDLVGFTQLSEKIGPEETYSIMDHVYDILIQKVHDYEGTVNEFTGDGIMALFGAPVALEDAPQRAIRSAYSIHREMTKFSAKLNQENKYLDTLKMRIGIHTGLVVVGTLGNDLRLEFKAVGNTVNLASRMEGMAQPGSTYVSEDTFRLTKGLFRFEVLGEFAVKGISQRVRAYRVIAPSALMTKFDVSAEYGLTPFVGRERELELLLDGFERVKSGRGQAFSVISEAGMGKSRLLYEFRKSVTNEDVTFLEGKCLSFSRFITYYPVVDILKSNFKISQSDDNSKIREKLRHGLKVLNVAEHLTLPFILELFAVKDSGLNYRILSPEAKKERMIRALNLLTVSASQIRPVIMVVEDLHWIDKSSEESLRALLENISGEKILMLFTYRPTYFHKWGAKSYHSQINLNRLSNRESLEIANHLLGTDDIDKKLENLILEKTEGVPFFIEELVKSLKNMNIIKRKETAYNLAKDLKKVSIPATIHDVIMARVDKLSEGAKNLIQVASVIEREFPYELIKYVFGSPQKELLSNISELKNVELIFERGISPKTTFVFSHALTRDVVYASITQKNKSILHEKIGNAIELIYKENISEYYEVLVEHFIKSENFTKGSKYSKLASKKARKAVSYTDAIEFANNRVICLEKLPRTKEVEMEIIDARVTLGLYYNQTQNFTLSKKVIDPIFQSALSLKYERRLAQIYVIIGTYNWAIQENIAEALINLKKAINITKSINDFITMVMANHYVGHVLSDNCEFDEALFHLKTSLELVEAGNLLMGIAVHKSCIARTIYFYKGDVDLSYSLSLEGLRFSEEIDDAFSKAEAYLSFGISCYGKRELDEAEIYLAKALEYCSKFDIIGLQSIALYYLGESYYSKKDYKNAKKQYQKAIYNHDNYKYSQSTKNLNYIALERTNALSNEKSIDLDALYIYAYENKIKLYQGRIYRIIGEILLYKNDQNISNAESYAKKAIKYDENNCVMFELGLDYLVYAEILKVKNEIKKAKAILREGAKIFKECGADGWTENTMQKISHLS